MALYTHLFNNTLISSKEILKNIILIFFSVFLVYFYLLSIYLRLYTIFS